MVVSGITYTIDPKISLLLDLTTKYHETGRGRLARSATFYLS
jgi:hypothetical protein